ncbi:MAG: hypothetical protein OEY96_04335, partial [Gammaproteobacteria bacterium]|nr:hypothetical protein [Gammaproteobacteria bacterium]
MVRQLIILLFFAFSISAASQINNLNEQSDSVEEDPMDIRVVGLFKDAALVKFNGKQKLYRKGANISDDIQLISATTSKATFMIQGKKVEMGLDKSGGYNYSSNRNQNYSDNQGQSQNSEQNQNSAQQESVESSGLKTAKILRNPGGMYMTLGYINGRSVKFLVDTGASQVAMN